MKPEFSRIVTIKCKNEYCNELVTCYVGKAKANGKYCPSCREESQRIFKQNYWDRNSLQIKARRRKRAKERRAAALES